MVHFLEDTGTSSLVLGEEDRVSGDLIPCVLVITGESASSWRKSGSKSRTLGNASSCNISRFRTGSCASALGEIIQEEGLAGVGV